MKESLLHALLSQPTAPFRESHVKRVVTEFLEEASIRHFEDPAGNIVVGVKSKAEYLARIRKPGPTRFFIAHMDHPGFHGVKWVRPGVLSVKWLGGSPTKHLNGAKVWLADELGYRGEGTLQNTKLNERGTALGSAEVKFKTPSKVEATSLFGGFGFRAPVWKGGQKIFTKAADDLVGVFVIISLAAQVGNRAPFIGLLTRAEEVGLVGAIHHFGLGWLRGHEKKLLCVSLETSRTLPGAMVGKGPVVRLGDRTTTFHSGALEVFTRLAKAELPEKHQRRIMDGGTCEGTVATAFGLPTIGISIPLGNYHNQNFEGGPDARGKLGPAPEFVHEDDIEGMKQLCKALMKPGLRFEAPWAERLREFHRLKSEYAPLMNLS